MIEHCHCQKINPADWHEKNFFWEKPRFFYRVTTRMAFHQPFSYHEDIAHAMAKARSKGFIINDDALILLKSGLFRGEILIEIQSTQKQARPNNNSSVLQLDGGFYAVVSQVPLMQMGKEIDKLTRDLKKRGEKVKNLYLCLLTCPLCAREKGNQTIIIAHLH